MSLMSSIFTQISKPLGGLGAFPWRVTAITFLEKNHNFKTTGFRAVESCLTTYAMLFHTMWFLFLRNDRLAGYGQNQYIGSVKQCYDRLKRFSKSRRIYEMLQGFAVFWLRILKQLDVQAIENRQNVININCISMIVDCRLNLSRFLTS